MTHPTSCFLEISITNGYGNYHEEIKTENEKMIFGQTYSRNFEIITQVGCNKNIDGGALISDCAILESVYI